MDIRTIERKLDLMVGHKMNKMDIVHEVSKILGVDFKSTKAVRKKESGCDDRFDIDVAINNHLDAYVEIYFESTNNPGVYNITETSIDIETY